MESSADMSDLVPAVLEIAPTVTRDRSTSVLELGGVAGEGVIPLSRQSHTLNEDIFLCLQQACCIER